MSALNPYEAIQCPVIVNVKYIENNQPFTFTLPLDKYTLAGSLIIERDVNRISSDQLELKYKVHAKHSVLLEALEFELQMDLTDNVMMTEGFQCWSTTKEMKHYNRLAPIPSPVAWITQFNLQGDYDFFNYSGTPGNLHATGYTFLRHTDHFVFIGSISEHSGYSYYKADTNNNRWSFYKDIQGKSLETGQDLDVSFVAFQNLNQPEIWSRYAAYYDPKGEFKNPRHLTGWSSWYNFYERVTEKDVMNSLNAFEKHPYPIDIMQVDDGYQEHIGDWLHVNNKFPRGMKALADDIKATAKTPGIWLAPFAAGFKSKLATEHPDWLLKYPGSNQSLVAGPNWGGFYALDIYHPDVRSYLKTVFDTVTDNWGYGLLKLDFLFAAAMIPRLGKSRGEIMWDATSLIVELTQKRALILGSGVTLPSTWGKFEYNRVSSDASPWWDHTVLRLANVRERVATANAITSTLNRWPMGSTVFGSDPDVFFIRSNNNKLTKAEKHSLLIVNIVLGQLTLISDDINLYSPSEHALYASTFPKPQAQVIDLKPVGIDSYRVEFTCNQRQYLFFTNLSPLPFVTHLDDAVYFEHGNLLDNSTVHWHFDKDTITLKPHETRLFMKITDRFMGSTGHIVPGNEIESLYMSDKIQINLKPNFSNPNTLYIRLDPDQQIPPVYVNQSLVQTKKHVLKNITMIQIVF